MALVTKLGTCIIGKTATISTEGSTTSGMGTYSIEYEFGSLTGVIKSNISPTSIPSTISWTVPTSFYNEIPNDTSKIGKLISYYTVSGTKSVNATSTFTAKISDIELPSITYSVATVDSTSYNLSGDTTTIINGVSNVKVTVTATPSTGSTLVSKGFTYQGNWYSMTLQNTVYLTGGYSDMFQFSASDSRGRVGKTNITYNKAVDYKKPTISLDSVSISAGGVATISTSGSWFNGSFGSTANTLTVQYRYKLSSSSSWGSWTSMTTSKYSDGTYSATATRSGLSYTSTYTFEARVVDKINTISSKDYSGKSLPVFDWSDSDFNFNVPVTIQQYYGDTSYVATKGYVDDLNDVAMAAIEQNSNAIAAIEVPTKSDIVDMIYPVGSIYMSVNSTSPATLFGGSWTQLKDRFLLGAGSTYTNGSTGGASTARLAVANLPSHTHPQYIATSSGGSLSVNYDNSGWSTAGKAVAQGIATGATGTGTAFSILPPYLVVYMWKRTA